MKNKTLPVSTLVKRRSVIRESFMYSWEYVFFGPVILMRVTKTAYD